MKTQQDIILSILSDGRWHDGVAELMREAYLPDYRKRLSELVAIWGSSDLPLPDGSWRFESRMRKHESVKRGVTHRKDWRDTKPDIEHKHTVRAQVAEAQRWAGDAEDGREAYTFIVAGVRVLSLRFATITATPARKLTATILSKYREGGLR